MTWDLTIMRTIRDDSKTHGLFSLQCITTWYTIERRYYRRDVLKVRLFLIRNMNSKTILTDLPIQNEFPKSISSEGAFNDFLQ